jgi:hypothetical protein
LLLAVHDVGTVPNPASQLRVLPWLPFTHTAVASETGSVLVESFILVKSFVFVVFVVLVKSFVLTENFP